MSLKCSERLEIPHRPSPTTVNQLMMRGTRTAPIAWPGPGRLPGLACAPVGSQGA
jgi:hypothetical protein